jgi:hypothetical protein
LADRPQDVAVDPDLGPTHPLEERPHDAPYRLSSPAAARQAPPTMAAQGMR